MGVAFSTKETSRSHEVEHHISCLGSSIRGGGGGARGLGLYSESSMPNMRGAT